MLAAIICLFLNAQAARWLALLTTLVLFVLGIVLWANYDIGGLYKNLRSFLIRRVFFGSLVVFWGAENE